MGGIGNEPHVKPGRGRHVPTAELPHRLTEVEGIAAHRTDALVRIRDADDEPTTRGVGERGNDLGNLATDALPKGLLELERISLVILAQLGEVGERDVLKRKRPASAIPEWTERHLDLRATMIG